MSEKYKFTDLRGMYFVTMTTVGWVDVFSRPELKQVVINSLRFCQKEKGLIVHAWCLMPSHLHMIISSTGAPLPSILRDFKKFTSMKLVELIDTPYESRRDWMLDLFRAVGAELKRITRYKLWQDGNHPILLTKPKFTRQKLDYIHNNPVAEEIVGNPEHYLYSSARDYCTDGRSYLEIERIE